ncbi:MAG: hypothetical protein ACRDQE_00910 [Gaiellales bacterium]
MFPSSTSGGSSPVWLTVLAARFVGGLLGGMVGYVIVRGSVNAQPLGSGTTSTSRLIVLIVPMLLNAAIMGLAIKFLLPRMSSRTVGLGNATMAAFAGGMVPLIAGLALASGAGSHAVDVFFVAGLSFISIASAILGVAVTAWMVETSSHELERWRGETVPVDPSWSSIGSVGDGD